MDTTTQKWIPRKEVLEILSITDRKLLDKLPIRKLTLSRQCVRYSLEDLNKLIGTAETGEA